MTNLPVKLYVSAKAAIMRDGKVLLMKESTQAGRSKVGQYQFPGGRIEEGEAFTDGLKLELKEETGLRVKPAQLITVREWWPIVKGVKLHIVAIFVACEIEDGDIIISPEHDDFAWVAKEAYDQYDIMTPDNEVAQIVLGLKPNSMEQI